MPLPDVVGALLAAVDTVDAVDGPPGTVLRPLPRTF